MAASTPGNEPDQPLIIILAAGKGTRMVSSRPKVLHEVAGLSLLGHVLKLVQGLGACKRAVVIGPDQDAVRAEVAARDPQAGIYVQQNQLGTCDAVLAAAPAFDGHTGPVVVLYGDVPLLRTTAVDDVISALETAETAVLGFMAEDPTGYGRLIRDQADSLIAIREQKDATDVERDIAFCNSGVMAFRGAGLVDRLRQIGNANASGEYYLTDMVAQTVAAGGPCAARECPGEDVLGVNTRGQLAQVEQIYQRRRRQAALAGGVTMQAPDTVTFAHDTELASDIVLEPDIFFGPGVRVATGTVIRAFSHLEGATVGANCTIGPFARVRPGTILGEGARLGNFVEIKAADIAAGAKVNHLSYVGDATIGAAANIGAGTITCNYDGFAKHKTRIGAGAFIGSNTALVAPVRIGDGAYVGSGSVITRDVDADALALTRAPLDTRPGWAAKFRAMMTRRKTSRAS